MTVFVFRQVSKISVRRALTGHAAAARPSFPAGDPADLASLRNVCSAARRESMSAISADASAGAFSFAAATREPLLARGFAAAAFSPAATSVRRRCTSRRTRPGEDAAFPPRPAPRPAPRPSPALLNRKRA